MDKNIINRISERLYNTDKYDEYLENLYPYQEGEIGNYPDNELEIDLEENMKVEIGEHNSRYEFSDLDGITKWSPFNFKLESTTMWSFPNRGDWATHNPKYRGNWSPYIPRNLILRYTKEDDIVLDQFLGSGTTVVEAKLLKRNSIGIDINDYSIKISKGNVSFGEDGKYCPNIYKGDARNLNYIEDCSVDLICTHPPYSNIIKYSEGLEGDLSLLAVVPFLEEINKVAKESYRVLKRDKYCAILMGDIRQKKHIVPLGFQVMQQFLNSGFVLKEIVIKEQHNCKANSFWYNRSLQYNFLLIAHEYVFIFRKP